MFKIKQHFFITYVLLAPALSLLPHDSQPADVTPAVTSVYVSYCTPTSGDPACVNTPEIGFDQTAFDLEMGANTFVLDEFYNIAFSPNIVPIPPAVWLFGSALMGVLGLGRCKRG